MRKNRKSTNFERDGGIAIKEPPGKKLTNDVLFRKAVEKFTEKMKEISKPLEEFSYNVKELATEIFGHIDIQPETILDVFFNNEELLNKGNEIADVFCEFCSSSPCVCDKMEIEELYDGEEPEGSFNKAMADVNCSKCLGEGLVSVGKTIVPCDCLFESEDDENDDTNMETWF